jgi:hypothetical protein
LRNLTPYYTSLITSQYQNSPNLLAWVASNIEILEDVSLLIDDIDNAFDIDRLRRYLVIEDSSGLYNKNILANESGLFILTEDGLEITRELAFDDGDHLITEDNFYLLSEGDLHIMLDVIGEIVGQARLMKFQPTGGLSAILDDESYLILLKAKIRRNSWDGKLTSIYNIWRDLFPNGDIAVVDAQNMTLSVVVSGDLSSIIIDLIQNDLIVPRPEGVLMTYSFGDIPKFGFDLDDTHISGFDIGKW